MPHFTVASYSCQDGRRRGAARRDKGLQEGLLATGDPPAGGQQQQVAGHVRLVGQCQQRHARLFRRAVRLARVAVAAGRGQVRVHVESAAGRRHHVIAGQLANREALSAIKADMAVAGEQDAVVHHRPATLEASAAIPHGDDRADPEQGTAAIAAGAAMQAKTGLAGLPAHTLTRIQGGSLLPAQPLDGHAAEIDLQDMWNHGTSLLAASSPAVVGALLRKPAVVMMEPRERIELPRLALEEPCSASELPGYKEVAGSSPDPRSSREPATPELR